MLSKHVVLHLCVLESQGSPPIEESNALKSIDGSSLSLNSLQMQVEVDCEVHTSVKDDSISFSMAHTKQTARKENPHQGTPA